VGLVGRTAAGLAGVGWLGNPRGRPAPTPLGLRPPRPAAPPPGRAIEAQDARGVARFGRRVAGPAPATIDRLAEITAPALVLVGALDGAYQRAAEVMRAKLPNARSAVIANAGHCVNIEESAAFDRAVLEFLQSR
jgi:pimeloyl-ACP methyl ester carboxylesterase